MVMLQRNSKRWSDKEFSNIQKNIPWLNTLKSSKGQNPNIGKPVKIFKQKKGQSNFM